MTNFDTVPPAVRFATASLRVNLPKAGPTGMHIRYQVQFAREWIIEYIEKYAVQQFEFDVRRVYAEVYIPRVSLPRNVRKLSSQDYATALTARHAIILMEDYLDRAEDAKVERDARIVSLRLYDQAPALEKVVKCARTTIRNVVERRVGSELGIPATRGPKAAEAYRRLAEEHGVAYYPNGLEELKDWCKATEEAEGIAMCARFIWGTLAIHMVDPEGPFGWTHEQVAKWLGVDRSTVSRIVDSSVHGVLHNRETQRLLRNERDHSQRTKIRRRKRLRLIEKGITPKGAPVGRKAEGTIPKGWLPPKD